MAILTLTNLSSSRLPVNSYVGVLAANETRQVTLTGNELELSRTQLLSLTAAGLLSWSTATSASDDDNQAELVVGGARVLSGTGDPNSVVIGSPGDLYTDKAGGAGATLYVKESGVGTNTGWAAK